MCNLILFKICILFLNYYLISNQDSFLNKEPKNIKLQGEDIINVRCFWIKGLNVYDISPLEKTDKT